MSRYPPGSHLGAAMTRLDMLTVLIKAVGVYCAAFGFSNLAFALWFVSSTGRTWAVGVKDNTATLAQPTVFMVVGLFLAFGGRLVARILGESPRPN